MSGISIAMAAYRGEKHVGAQLDSLLVQTRHIDEIVICDDSPDDATERAVAPYCGRLPIRYSRNPVPLGASANFERAVSLATGRIILLADQDDFWLPQKVERLTAPLDGAEPLGAFCDSTLTDAALSPLGRTHWQLREFSAAEPFGSAEEQFSWCCRRVPAAGHNMAFDARLREILLPFPPLEQSHDTWIGLVLAAFGAWRVIPGELTLFRQHGGNLSGAGRDGALQSALHSLRSNTFAWNESLYALLCERLRHANAAPAILTLAEARLEYSRIRSAMAGKGVFRRLPGVMQLWCSGDYRRFGRGAASIVQDLVLRSFA